MRLSPIDSEDGDGGGELAIVAWTDDSLDRLCVNSLLKRLRPSEVWFKWSMDSESVILLSS